MMQRRTITFGVTAVSLAVAIPLVAAGLPAGAKGGHDPRPPRATTTTTTPSPLPTSATYSYAVTVTGLPSTSGPIDVTGTITADFTAKTTEVTASIPTAIGPLAAGTLDLIIKGRTIYVSAPGLATVTRGRPWVSFSAPASVKELFKGIPGVKDEMLVGRVPSVIAWLTTHPANHPVATITSAVTAGSLTTTNLLITPPIGRGAPRPAGATTVPTSVPVSLTADATGRLTAATFSTSIGAATVSGSVTSTGYDAPVTIVVPSEDQTFRLPPKLLGLLGGMAGLATASHADRHDVVGAQISAAASQAASHIGTAVAHLESRLHLGS